MQDNRIMVAGLSADRQYIGSIVSFNELKIRSGDKRIIQSGTRGDVGRSVVCANFLASEYDALLLCDLDQKFPADMVEKLRAHDLDMVSGHYMKRTTKHFVSIWQTSEIVCDWPYLHYSYDEVPSEGLHRIANTGMGCVLIKREVIEAVSRVLPPGSNPFEIGKLPSIAPVQTNFGSDYRFFYIAQRLGFELWGDASIDTPHASTLWITRNVIEKMVEQKGNWYDLFYETTFLNSIRSKGMLNSNAAAGRAKFLKAQIDSLDKDDPDYQKKEIYLSGQLDECAMWLDVMKKEAPHEVVSEIWMRNVFGWQIPGEEQQPEKQHPQIPYKHEYIGNVDKGITLPTFASKSEAEAAIARRNTAIDGESEVEAEAMRRLARQREDTIALQKMSGKNEHYMFTPWVNTSTEPGETDVLDE